MLECQISAQNNHSNTLNFISHIPGPKWKHLKFFPLKKSYKASQYRYTQGVYRYTGIFSSQQNNLPVYRYSQEVYRYTGAIFRNPNSRIKNPYRYTPRCIDTSGQNSYSVPILPPRVSVLMAKNGLRVSVHLPEYRYSWTWKVLFGSLFTQ